MERRVLLAVFLSFLVLYAYQALLVKPAPKPTAGSASSAVTTAGNPSAPPVRPVVPRAAAPIASAALVGETTEREIRVETKDVIAVFTNRGARLKSWRLKHYLDKQGRPQELVENRLEDEPLPFTLRTSDDQINATINTALYSVSGAPTASESAATDLRFEYRDSAGLRTLKTVHIEPSSYILTLSAIVTAGDRLVPSTVFWGPAFGEVGETSQYVKKVEGLLFQDGKPRRLAAKVIFVTQASTTTTS
jgi:YidC/Oxa1 family membrane protein insertase